MINNIKFKEDNIILMFTRQFLFQNFNFNPRYNTYFIYCDLKIINYVYSIIPKSFNCINSLLKN